MNHKVLKTLLLWAIFGGGMLQTCWAETDHSPKWTGKTVISYDINPLDTFDPGDYLYCRWGNLMDRNTFGQINLHFTRLTKGPFTSALQNQDGPAADLFFSIRSLFGSDLYRTFPPSYAVWDPAGGSFQAGSVIYSAGSILDSKDVDLYRYLHFRNVLTNSLDNRPIDSSATKIIVLIHGWNPDSNEDSYAGSEFQALVNSLESQIQGTDWKLVLYHWEADSDTGPKELNAAVSGTEAAEIGNQHGWHLGELLTTKCPNLEKVHLIAHSAGSWVARGAARYLLVKNPTDRVQLTLLDPFMPSSVVAVRSVLGKSFMSGLKEVSGSSRIHLFENYWASDVDLAFGTSDTFDWRSGDVNLRVDWSVPFVIPIIYYYADHAGPILWYADTVASATGGNSNPGLANFDLQEAGWRRSLFCNEPVISSQPQDAATNIGGSATFTVTANTRIGHYSHYHCGELAYEWHKEGDNSIKGTDPSFTIPSVSASDAGSYFVIISNSTGPVTSQSAHLTVNGGALSPPNFSPASGSYQAPLDVALLGYPSDVTIRYTLNGTTPNGSSPVYNGSPIRLTTTTTIKAISQKSGFTDSPVKSATYTLSGYGTLPTITLINGGSVVVGATNRQWITINGTGFASGFSATFRDETYKTDWPTITDTERLIWDSATKVRVYAGVGTGPTEWSVRITNPNGASSEKKLFNVQAVGAVAQVATPAFSDVSGVFSDPIQLSMATITPDAQIRFTTDGSEPTASSQAYTGPLAIGVTTTVKAKAFKYGYTTSGTQTATFTISSPITGSLRVDLGPTAAVQAGARWQINGGAWHSSGETATGVSVGNPIVAFNTVSGWLSPLARSVTINAGLPTYDSATYIAENVAPTVPANPSPASGAGNVGRVNTVLSWTGGSQGGAVEYALKFGTNQNPGFYAGYGSIAGTSYTIPLTLEGGTVYYWGVRAKDSKGATTDSPVWSFTTAYSYSDLVPDNLNIAGTIAPGSNVTLSVDVRNTGTFVCPSAYVRFYLSSAAGMKEVQLTPSIAPPTRIDAVEPGQVRTVTFTVPLNSLQAGRSYIDAWIDSGQPGPFNENNFDNNLLSMEINYTDASAPEVTWAQLGQGGFIRTAYTNRILYAARDDTGVKTIDFLYSTNGGTTWAAIQTNYTSPRSCTYGDWYDWLIPTNIPVTSNFCVKVVAKDATGNSGEKIAGPYLLRNGVSPVVQVLSPNGGEVLDMSSTHNIQWNVSAPNGIERMVLWFYRNDSSEKIADITTNTAGVYSWSLPSFTTTSGKMRIELIDKNGNTAEDWSDAFFNIRDSSSPPPAPWGMPEVITTVPASPSDANRDHSSPRLAVDASGNVHMAYKYTEDLILGNPRIIKQTIYYKKRVGGIWTAPVPVYTLSQLGGVDVYCSLDQLQIDTTKSGMPAIVWKTTYSSSSNIDRNQEDVYYSYFNGSAWSVPENVSQSASYGLTNTASAYPSIVIDLSNTTHLAWQDGVSWENIDGSEVVTGTNKIYYRSKPVAQAWSAVYQVTTNKADTPKLAINDRGFVSMAYLSWTGTSSKVIAKVSQTNGVWASTESLINMPNVSAFDIDASGCDQPHAVWSWYNSVDKSKKTFYSLSSGGLWSPAETVSQMSMATYSICSDSSARPHIVAADAGSLGAVLYTSKSGGVWIPPVMIHSKSQLPSGNSFDAAMLPASNELHVVWTSLQNGHVEIIYNCAFVGSLNDVYPPAVNVTAPFSGQSIPSGSGFSIKWTANDNFGVSNIDLHYSANNGSSWQVIGTNQNNTGSYLWIAPSIGTNVGQVRVTARDPSGNVGMGYSGQFTTADLTPPTVAILSPSAGVTFAGNDIVNLKWSATDNVAVTELSIEYSSDNRESWREISRGLWRTNTLAWRVPNIATTGLFFRVTANDAAGFSSAYTSSQGTTVVRANNPPTKPASPFPLVAGKDVVYISPCLRWNSSDSDGDLITYQVRFGISPSPSIVYTGTENYFVPGILRPQTIYYWQVVASDGKTNVSSPVWSFTTAKAFYYPLTVSGGTGGGSYTNGQRITIAATVPVGMRFLNWNDGNTNTPRIITMSTGPVTYTANFTDIQKPTVLITAPTAALRTTNGQMIVKGTASDNKALINVLVQLNGESWANAGTTNGWKNWSSAVQLVAGSNTIRACSVDTAGNNSLTSTVVCTYVVYGNLIVQTNGLGTVMRAPAGVPEIGKTYTLTATPAAGYGFANWTDGVTGANKVVTFTMTSNKTVAANFTDTQKPTVAITSPTAALRTTNGQMAVKGTASDNKALTNVLVQLNGGAWTNAGTTNGLKNWSSAVQLVAGSNTIRACSVDTTGNNSLTSTVVCTYVVYGNLIVQTNGLGTVTRTPAGIPEMNKLYTLTATPAAGYGFANWTGAVTGTNKTATFTMTSNMTVTANFIDVQKPVVAITYPTASLRMTSTNAVFAARGTATDNKAVSNVLVQVNGGSWMSAGTTNGWKNWSLPATLTPGTNTICAYSVDTIGNCSPTSRVVCIYVEMFTLADYYPLPAGAEWLYDGTDDYGNPDKSRIRVISTNYTVESYTGRSAPRAYTTNCVHLISAVLNHTTMAVEESYDVYMAGNGRYGEIGEDGDEMTVRFGQGLIFPAQMVLGETASVNRDVYFDGQFYFSVTASLKVIEKTAITVSAGTFTNVLHVRCTMIFPDGSQSVWDEWWAKSIGMVKSAGVSSDDLSSCELIQYSLPSAPDMAGADISGGTASSVVADSLFDPQTAITVDGLTADWAGIPQNSFCYSSGNLTATQAVAVALSGNNIALLLTGCPFGANDTVLVYFKLCLTYGDGDDRHSVDLWTSGSVLYGMDGGRPITGLETVLTNGVLEVKFPVPGGKIPSQVIIEEAGGGMDFGSGTLTELFRFAPLERR